MNAPSAAWSLLSSFPFLFPVSSRVPGWGIRCAVGAGGSVRGCEQRWRRCLCLCVPAGHGAAAGGADRCHRLRCLPGAAGAAVLALSAGRACRGSCASSRPQLPQLPPLPGPGARARPEALPGSFALNAVIDECRQQEPPGAGDVRGAPPAAAEHLLPAGAAAGERPVSHHRPAPRAPHRRPPERLQESQGGFGKAPGGADG